MCKYKMKCRVLNVFASYTSYGLVSFMKSALTQLYMTIKSAKSVMFYFEIINTLNEKL